MSSTIQWGLPVTTHALVGIDGTPLHVIEAGSGPAVLLTHGFPELGYSWRHQVPELVDAGYRVIVPDQRGYGQSGQPEAIDSYDIEHLVGDLGAVLDQLGETSAHFVGHDWGAVVVWQASLLIADRLDSVTAMSVPFTPRPKHPPTNIWRQRFGDEFFYILYFQEPGVADADLGRDPALTMRSVLAGMAAGPNPAVTKDSGYVERLIAPETLPSWLSEAELAVYSDSFAASGFTGALNWYRNFDRNWELTPHLAGATVMTPSFFIGGTQDPVLAMTNPEAQIKFLEDHHGNVMIEGAGHWLQQERPEEVNAALLGFLQSQTAP